MNYFDTILFCHERFMLPMFHRMFYIWGELTIFDLKKNNSWIMNISYCYMNRGTFSQTLCCVFAYSLLSHSWKTDSVSGSYSSLAHINSSQNHIYNSSNNKQMRWDKGEHLFNIIFIASHTKFIKNWWLKSWDSRSCLENGENSPWMWLRLKLNRNKIFSFRGSLLLENRWKCVFNWFKYLCRILEKTCF